MHCLLQTAELTKNIVISRHSPNDSLVRAHGYADSKTNSRSNRTPIFATIAPWEAQRSHEALPAWQAPAAPATAGQGRKSRSGGAACAHLDGMALVRVLGFKRAGLTLRSHPNPRERANDQSTPRLGMATPEMCCPMRLSSTGRHGARHMRRSIVERLLLDKFAFSQIKRSD